VPLPQTTTDSVGFFGSFVVKVIVAPAAPGAVGSTVTVYEVEAPPLTDCEEFGATVTVAFVGVTVGTPSVNG